MNASKPFSTLPVFHLFFVLFFSLCTQIALARPEINEFHLVTLGDTTINDLSSRFKVTIPAIPVNLSDFTNKINVAVIPLNSLGAIDILWDPNQKQSTKETEKEFETELLKCINGKDAKGEAGAITKKNKLYCERTGYGDAGMGHYGELYYCGFVKSSRLIIVELSTYWSNCMNFGSRSETKKCETNQAMARQRIELMFGNIVRKIKVLKI